VLLSLQDLEGRSPDLLGHRASIIGGHHVLLAVQHQRRYLQRSRAIARVDQAKGLDQGRRHGGTGRGPFERAESLAVLCACHGGRDEISESSFAPVLN
jgi:hypothetical protein